METTRQTILSILRRRQATVDDLVQELGLAPATIRRHLDILGRDGHVDVSQVRRQTGRPHYLFSISDAGADLFPKHYVRLTNRLIDEIRLLTTDETSGRSGEELADLVFERMAQRLAQRIAPHIHGSTLAQRIEATTQALGEEGISFEMEESEEGYLLVGEGCPCSRMNESADHVCRHDERLLSLLLAADVTSVQLEASRQNGYCAYRVREAPGRQAKSGAGALPGDQLSV
ncbi:MAG: ArsR family transcriptional regulator [Dehalococcoidia bacterium]